MSEWLPFPFFDNFLITVLELVILDQYLLKGSYDAFKDNYFVYLV